MLEYLQGAFIVGLAVLGLVAVAFPPGTRTDCVDPRVGLVGSVTAPFRRLTIMGWVLFAGIVVCFVGGLASGLRIPQNKDGEKQIVPSDSTVKIPEPTEAPLLIEEIVVEPGIISSSLPAEITVDSHETSPNLRNSFADNSQFGGRESHDNVLLGSEQSHPTDRETKSNSEQLHPHADDMGNAVAALTAISVAKLSMEQSYRVFRERPTEAVKERVLSSLESLLEFSRRDPELSRLIAKSELKRHAKAVQELENDTDLMLAIGEIYKELDHMANYAKSRGKNP